MVKGLERIEFDELLKYEEGGKCKIYGMRKIYGDYDVGSKNWSLYKVVKGKVWFSKNSRKK